MRRICAWCGKELGQVEPLETPAFTHGICPDCLARWEEPGEVVEAGLQALGNILRQYPAKDALPMLRFFLSHALYGLQYLRGEREEAPFPLGWEVPDA